jgi:elongation factor Ts
MEFSIEDIKKLREATGAGIMDAKAALATAKGDADKAMEVLRNQGKAKASKKAGRDTTVSLIDAYVHMGRVGALVEMAAETDFVLKTDNFKELSHDIAMQISATNPLYVSPESVPASVTKELTDTFQSETQNSGKPPEVVAKIIQGKLDKFYQENCLLNQPFIKEPEKTVTERINEVIAIVGENIAVIRFLRLESGVASKNE